MPGGLLLRCWSSGTRRRAQVAEEKRSVFRALTRLRGAAITSYDGVARSQTGNIDESPRGADSTRVHATRANLGDLRRRVRSNAIK